LAVQCRDEGDVLAWLPPLNHHPTELAVTAERAFLAGLGGGCSLPIAAHAEMEGDTLQLRGRVTAPDGSEQIDVFLSGSADACELGMELAALALEKGAARLLKITH
jgi:hydroxymethylbilane synthase